MDKLTAAHSQHLNRAIDAIMASNRHQIATQATLSLCSESIARTLADAAQIEVGSNPILPWHELQPAHQARFRHLAEQAISSLDPARYEDSIEHAVTTVTLKDLESQVRGDQWGVEEIARETLAAFLSHQARPTVLR